MLLENIIESYNYILYHLPWMLNLDSVRVIHDGQGHLLKVRVTYHGRGHYPLSHHNIICSIQRQYVAQEERLRNHQQEMRNHYLVYIYGYCCLIFWDDLNVKAT